jgi:hypothetical protein
MAGGQEIRGPGIGEELVGVKGRWLRNGVGAEVIEGFARQVSWSLCN